jgi:hypothetical protein
MNLYTQVFVRRVWFRGQYDSFSVIKYNNVYFTVKKSNQHEKCEQEEAWCDANTSGI